MKRYQPEIVGYGPWAPTQAGMEEDPEGEWVRWEDVQARLLKKADVVIKAETWRGVTVGNVVDTIDKEIGMHQLIALHLLVELGCDYIDADKAIQKLIDNRRMAEGPEGEET